MSNEKQVSNEKEAILKIFKGMNDLTSRLYCRWLDEREYEDINEYGKVIHDDLVQYRAVLVKMTKKPFGFIFSLNGKKYKIGITMKKYCMDSVR